MAINPYIKSFQKLFVSFGSFVPHKEYIAFFNSLILHEDIIEVWLEYIELLIERSEFFAAKETIDSMIFRASHLNKLELLDALAYMLNNHLGQSEMFQSNLNLAHAYLKRKHYSKAYQNYLKLSHSRSDFSIVKNMGRSLAGCADREELIAFYQSKYKEFYQHVEFLNEMALAYYSNHQIIKAITIFKKALDIDNQSLVALKNLSLLSMEIGEIELAKQYFEGYFNKNPHDESMRRCFFFCLNYDPFASMQEIYQKISDWGKMIPGHSMYLNAQSKTESRSKRLRVGYVSPDFRQHAAKYLLEALLDYSDKDQVDVYCYANVSQIDEVTDVLREKAENWRFVRHLSESQIAHLIACDEIDVLVDVAGHTANHLLGVFALKPSPIQMTLYPMTTGIPNIDFRFIDPYLCPESSEKYNSEELIKLSHCFFCFEPSSFPPINHSLPSQKNGYVTFGSFNNVTKLNSSVLELWSQILKSLPDSKLMIKSKVLKDLEVQEMLLNRFQKLGINPSRIILSGPLSFHEHLNLYNQIDVALDPFPFNGHTTTCEALGMGVPVITLKGEQQYGDFSRAGFSILSHLALEQLITNQCEDYLLKAIEVSKDVQFRIELKQNLRHQIHESKLGDLKGFVASLEMHYKNTWQTYFKTLNSD